MDPSHARFGKPSSRPQVGFGKLIAQHDTVKRRLVVPAYRAVARTNVFFPGPRVFANSFPKAGTHLVSALLSRLPKMMFSGLHRAHGDLVTSPGDPPNWAPLQRDLGTIRHGQFATGHFPHDPALVNLLDRLGFVTIVCLRDPRDIAVSSVHYVCGLPSHDLHRRFTERYRTFDERLMAAIIGFEADEFGRGQESLGTRLARYLPWLSTAHTCVVRFEQIAGPSGGGSLDEQRAAVANIAARVARPLQGDALDRVCDRVWSSRSSTFQAGQSGGWRSRFNAAHIDAVKRTCGQQLVDLGYERTLDW